MSFLLLTYGGTEVPIDSVRSLTNTSTGRFGRLIAVELLSLLVQRHIFLPVVLLRHERAPGPFEITIRLDKNQSPQEEKESSFLTAILSSSPSVTEYTFRSYEEYQAQLEMLCLQSPLAVILAAAVSDYILESTALVGKIETKEFLQLSLTKARKLIDQIKLWCPSTYLIGFKLTAYSSEEETVQKGVALLHRANCDIVVANDLLSIRQGEHTIHLLSLRDNEVIKETFKEGISVTSPAKIIAEKVLTGVHLLSK